MTNETNDDITRRFSVKKRHTVSIAIYDEVLNLVKNTLKIDETEALVRAGYSGKVSTNWRQDEKAPRIAVNALRGLLVGLEIQRAQDKDQAKQPLRLSVDDLELLLQALAQLDLKSREAPAFLSLRAALHREIARRLEGKS